MPSIDLIDFTFPCLAQALRRPLGGVGAQPRPDGETVLRLPLASDAHGSRHPEKLLLAAPRGYCAGVDRAVQTVERALELYGPPVYVRKEIVHNKHVVEQLRARAVFVEEETDVPEGETVVFSAHGVAPSVHANAEARSLRTVDATCPLVTKVHVEAKKFAAEGYTIVLIGHEGHEEVEGTMGEAPDHFVLDRDRGGRGQPRGRRPRPDGLPRRPRLSVDETDRIIRRLRERFPNITGPKSDDICYATTNRQMAVRQMARECDLVLVIGSRNSSNSNRLVEVARDHGADAQLVDNELQVREEWPRASAWSAPARGERPRGAGPAARRVLPRARHEARLRVRGRPGGRPFMLPREIRKALAARANCTACSRTPGDSAVTVPKVS